MSKILTDIAISTPHYEYVGLSCSVRALLPLKNLIKKVIKNLGIDSEKIKFVSIYTVYEDNNVSKVVETSPRMTPTSKQISVNYYWCKQHVGKELVIQKIRVRKSKGRYFHQRFKM